MLQTTMVPMLEASDEHVFTDALSPALMVRGENWALSGIYGPYAGLVFSIALKILNDQSGAEEVVQQVSTKVWRHARDAQGTFGRINMREALQHIPSQERMVVELACWSKMTHRAAALYYHFPLGTVKTHIRLGMQRWKLLFQESERLDEAIQDEQLL